MAVVVRRRFERRTRPARAALWLVATCDVLLVSFLAVELMLGRPHADWSFQPAENQLTVSLAPGDGPFGAWLDSGAGLSAGGQQGRQLQFTLPAGRTTDIDVTVNSLFPTSQTVSVVVPALPAPVVTTIDQHTLTVRFSTPVTPLNAPCGVAEGLFSVESLIFPRGPLTCSGVIDVQSPAG